MKNNPILAIIVPAYNEEAVLREAAVSLKKIMTILTNNRNISSKSYICFVDDGSKDKTWDIIEKLNKEFKSFKGIKLARNFGHQNAILSGLFICKADLYITIDADLQDDENAIIEMVDRYKKGSEVVYGVRESRKSDSFFKRSTALLFYKFMKWMGVDSVFNHADYRLMSYHVVEHLKKFEEINLFLRAITPLIGFKNSIVYYDRRKRFAGESKYPLRKMLSFAWDGITSFSFFPLKIVSFFGFCISLTSFAGIVFVIYGAIVGKTIPGWASTVTAIFFVGGIQLLGMGIIGEYIGKIYKEVKRRPRFIVERELL